ncbi:MAG: hypothetical protein WA180_12665 [Candidatus Sulfotelmatobacter sp.]
MLAKRSIVESKHPYLPAQRPVERGREMRVVDSILSLGGLLVPIVAILVGGAIAIVGMIIRHQERLAKIERGMDPDAPPRS